MSDEYKDRYIIIGSIAEEDPSSVLHKIDKKHHGGSQRTDHEGNMVRQNYVSPKYV